MICKENLPIVDDGERTPPPKAQQREDQGKKPRKRRRNGVQARNEAAGQEAASQEAAGKTDVTLSPSKNIYSINIKKIIAYNFYFRKLKSLSGETRVKCRQAQQNLWQNRGYHKNLFQPKTFGSVTPRK